MQQNNFESLLNILNYKFLSLPLYKIILAFVVLFLFLALRRAFTLYILKFFRFLVRKTKTELDDKFLKAIKNPLRFVFVIAGLYFFFLLLEVDYGIVNHILKGLLIFDIFWALYNIVGEFEEYIYKALGKFGRASREFVSFIIKLLKIFIVSIGIIALLQDWGINVTGFLASLGLGGLAFALAAKDTAANIFGGIAILTDNIFKIGEWVKVGNVEGIVEDIGMRTTKIRAFDKRLIILPNATIANSAVENYSRRDKRRIMMRIGLVYNTPIETIKKITDEIRDMLLNHPDIAKDESLLIYFDQFEDSSLSIFCYFFTNTAVWKDYLRIREDINLKIIEIVERNGSAFAFPSNSIYFETPLKIEK
ncbi:mechanosensitive ion channel family protein [Caminibacter pacificus]|uniref:Mechanosensitive ion channel family protein n=1 Tax=Caminibacter pacificus TaxID=1424653 RepID=A0AAJ4RBS0_9BACT|nr:mechanosensitive ion channel family protein [Caminibacter pacificus]QCI29069.1 mechanosensitive ion channel family protein [Caminibacter pacificus]ROR39112.1 MscS family membrane protein [Caminibacter pacificus]